jgi:hypothetical protein
MSVTSARSRAGDQAANPADSAAMLRAGYATVAAMTVLALVRGTLGAIWFTETLWKLPWKNYGCPADFTLARSGLCDWIGREIANPPFGRQIGEETEVAPFYSELVEEFDRVLAPDGKAVIYAARMVRSTTIFRQSLDGGPPEETASFEQDELFDFGHSIDGQFLAVTRGGWQHDIVLISDLQSAMKSR